MSTFTRYIKLNYYLNWYNLVNADFTIGTGTQNILHWITARYFFDLFCLINFAVYKITCYLLTPWCKVLLEQLTGLQLVKKFLAFHGTRRFITALTSVRHLSLSWASPFQSIYPHPTLLEIHPNIIYPSKPKSSQWSLSLWFPHQDPIHPPLLIPYAPHAQSTYLWEKLKT